VQITTLSSRELNQDIGRAKRAAKDGPVIITDRGSPAHVLLTYDAWRRLNQTPQNLVEALAARDPNDIDFEIPRLEFNLLAADRD
jgi:prevent-host-death family protein